MGGMADGAWRYVPRFDMAAAAALRAAAARGEGVG